MATPEEREYLQQVAAEYRRRKPTATPDETKQVLSTMLEKRRARSSGPVAELPTIDRHALTVAEGVQDLPQQTPGEVIADVQARGFQPDEENKIVRSVAGAAKDVAKVKAAQSLVEQNTGPGVVEKLKTAAAGAGGAVLSGVQKLASAIGTPAGLLRHAIAPGDQATEGVADAISKAYRGKIGTPEQFTANVERPDASVLAKVVSGIGDVAKQGANTSSSEVYDAMTRFGGVEVAKTPEEHRKTLEQIQPTVDEAVAAAQKGTKEFLLGAGVDPLLPLSLGTKGASTAIGGQMARLLELENISGPQAAKAVRLAQKIIETQPGAKVDKLLRATFKAVGGKDVRNFENVFGKGSTYAGKSGAAYFGVEAADVAAKTKINRVLPENLTRRAVEPIAEAARTMGFRPRGTSHERLFKNREAIKSRHRATASVQEALNEYKEKVAPLLPADAARRRELIENFVDPPPGHVPAVRPPDPKEAQGLNELQAFFDRLGQKYQQSGVVQNIAGNATTGRYIPRLYTEDEGAVRNFIRRYVYEPDFPELKQTSSTHARSAASQQKPLGGQNPGFTAPTDPHEIVGQYLPTMERAVESSRFRKLLQRFYGRDIPSDAQKRFATAFGGGRVKILDAALNMFKEQQLFASPRFHMANVVEDTAKMVASGFRDPNSFDKAGLVHDINVPDTFVLGTTPAGRQVTAGEVRKAMRDNGFTRSSAYQDLEQPGRSFSAFANESDKAAGIGPVRRAARRAKEAPLHTAAEAFKDATTLGARRVGKKFAEAWDSRSKTALFVDRVMQGDSFDQAAANVGGALYDYADQGAVTRAAKRVAPFAGFTAKSLENVPRLIAQRPAVASLPQNALDALIGEDDPNRRDAPPQFMAETGPTIPLGQGAREAVGAAFNALGAPIDPAHGIAVRPRGLLLESLAPFAEAAGRVLPGRGETNLEPFGMMAAPYLQPFIEGFAGKSLVNKQELGPLSLSGSFPLVPAGTPGLPASLEAAPGSSSLSQYGASWLGPWASLAGNYAALENGAYQAPFNFQQPFSDNARQRLLFSLMSLLGAPAALTSPADAYKNAARRDTVKQAAEVPTKIREELRRSSPKK